MKRPIPAIEDIIPHRHPIVMVDALIEASDDGGVGAKTFREGDYGLDGEKVMETALVESIAQTAAAVQGERFRREGGGPKVGFLVTVSGFRFLSEAVRGEKLLMTVRVLRRLGRMALVAGSASCDGRTVAEGELKFYLP
ncbi:MAG: hypothetical protein ACYTKD_06420 [Planctomycetota bacterium]|jgi:3-hydroxyacyl-[acyl-carrier-protein] dehydratase